MSWLSPWKSVFFMASNSSLVTWGSRYQCYCATSWPPAKFHIPGVCASSEVRMWSAVCTAGLVAGNRRCTHPTHWVISRAAISLCLRCLHGVVTNNCFFFYIWWYIKWLVWYVFGSGRTPSGPMRWDQIELVKSSSRVSPNSHTVRSCLNLTFAKEESFAGESFITKKKQNRQKKKKEFPKFLKI